LEDLAMSERRAMQRIPINRAAQLSFGGLNGRHPCVVRDINVRGACISTPYYIFANEFALSFDGHRGAVTCRIIWRKATLCGVCFVASRSSPHLASEPGGATNVVRLDRQAYRG
jgi:hypothetical protein